MKHAIEHIMADTVRFIPIEICMVFSRLLEADPASLR